MHRAHPLRARRLAVQQVQEVAADRVVVGLDVDALAVDARSDTSTAASNRARPSGGRRCRARRGWLWSSFSGSAQPSADTPVRITSIGCADGGQLLEHRLHRGGNAAQRFQLAPCTRRAPARSAACHARADRRFPRTRTVVGEIEDVVAAVVQVVAGAADGAERGVACGDAGQGDGLLGLRGGDCHIYARIPCSTRVARARTMLVHRSALANSASSFAHRRDSRDSRRARRASAWSRRLSSACRRCARLCRR